MNKVRDILFRTVVPVTIGTTVFVGGIWLIDKNTRETNFDDCEAYNVSNTFYLKSIFVIVAIVSLYKLFIAELVNRKITNKGLSGYLLKILAFALYISVVSLVISVVSNGSMEAMVAVHFFLVGCILGLINSLSYFVCRKFLLKGKL